MTKESGNGRPGREFAGAPGEVEVHAVPGGDGGEEQAHGERGPAPPRPHARRDGVGDAATTPTRASSAGVDDPADERQRNPPDVEVERLVHATTPTTPTSVNPPMNRASPRATAAASQLRCFSGERRAGRESRAPRRPRVVRAGAGGLGRSRVRDHGRTVSWPGRATGSAPPEPGMMRGGSEARGVTRRIWGTMTGATTHAVRGPARATIRSVVATGARHLPAQVLRASSSRPSSCSRPSTSS